MFLGFNTVDWAVLVLAAVVAATGWSQGLVVGLLSFVGFVGGAVGGLLLVPELLGGLNPGLGTSVLGVAVVLVVAFVGQAVLAWVGRLVRSRIAVGPARRLDAAAGSVLAVAGLLVAAWAVGLAVASAAIPRASAAVRESVVLRTVDDLVPISPERFRTAFRSVVEAGGFPEVVAPWVPEPIRDVPPPSPGLAREPAVRAAARSVVKVVGHAPGCDAIVAGSGFVVARNRVMTNAHVVAGVDAPTVQVAGEEPLDARVVLFDPATDVAVLLVPAGLNVPALKFREPPEDGADLVVVGYPGNGSLRSEPGRSRGRFDLLGRDIYGEEAVARDVLSLRADVGHGNSGGPVVADDGRVYGMVFASSLTDPDTGYALTPDELAGAREGAGARDPVDTGRCLR